MRALRLVAVVLASATLAAEFNFEIAKRTVDNVVAFLEYPTFPASENAKSFDSGFHLEGADNIEPMRRLFFSQIRSAIPAVDLLYAGFEDGMFIGYFQNNSGAGYDYTFKPNGTVLREYYTTNSNNRGEPDGGYGATYRSRDYDPRVRPWYTLTKDSAEERTWSSVYTFATTGTLGITYSQKLRNTSNSLVGVTAIDYELSAIDSFLRESFSADGSRVVYIYESDGDLIASSVEGVSVETTESGPVQVPAVECSNAIIRESAQFLADLNNPGGVLFVHNGQYIQSTKYTSEGSFIDWTIVVVRPSHVVNDHVEAGSIAEYVMVVMGTITCLITLALGSWVIKYRNMQMWRLAQPMSMLLLLVANFMCNLSTFVMLGENTDFTCALRQWWLALAVTLTCAAFLAKVGRVYLVAKTTGLKTKTVTVRHVFMAVGVVMGLQMLVLAIWTALDPFQATTSFQEQASGEIEEHLSCNSDDSWGFALVATIIGMMFAAGCYLSYLTRHYSERFAESRGLTFTFYHGMLIATIMLSVGGATNVQQGEFAILIALGLTWFTITTQLLLFGPRIYRQLTLGDLDPDELRETIAKQVLHHPSHRGKSFAMTGVDNPNYRSANALSTTPSMGRRSGNDDNTPETRRFMTQRQDSIKRKREQSSLVRRRSKQLKQETVTESWKVSSEGSDIGEMKSTDHFDFNEVVQEAVVESTVDRSISKDSVHPSPKRENSTASRLGDQVAENSICMCGGGNWCSACKSGQVVATVIGVNCVCGGGNWCKACKNALVNGETAAANGDVETGDPPASNTHKNSMISITTPCESECDEDNEAV